jgi:hypothetical protein
VYFSTQERIPLSLGFREPCIVNHVLSGAPTIFFLAYSNTYYQSYLLLDMASHDDSDDNFDHIQDHHIKQSTWAEYDRHMKKLSSTLINCDRFKDALDDKGSLKVPCNLDILKFAFLKIAKKSNGDFNKSTTTQKYLSALVKYHHKYTGGFNIDPSHYVELSKFIKGLKNKRQEKVITIFTSLHSPPSTIFTSHSLGS